MRKTCLIPYAKNQGQLCSYSEIQEKKLELTVCPGKLMDYRT